jgi:DNA-binding GntR family transcriptional regulator
VWKDGPVSPAAYSLTTASVTDALYDALRTRIINGDIAQGEKLTEVRVATEYEVARPTAKACLERLLVVGLLKRTAHKTAVVPTLGETDVRDLFFTRALVETSAVELLAAAAPAPAGLRRTQDAMELATRTGVFPDQVAADIEFHSLIVSETGSERLTRMHQLILGEVEMSMGLWSAHKAAPGTSVAAEHAAIIEAIDAGDTAGAADRMRAHLDAARARIIARMQETAGS